jgi:hypothetical protein
VLQHGGSMVSRWWLKRWRGKGDDQIGRSIDVW